MMMMMMMVMVMVIGDWCLVSGRFRQFGNSAPEQQYLFYIYIYMNLDRV